MKYLVAVDGSQHAQRALDLACELAKGREHDELIVLTAIEDYAASDILDEDLVLLAGEALSKANTELRESAEAVMESAAQHCGKLGLNVRGLVVSGGTRDAIVETAKKEKADVIVVGSRGLGTLSRLLLGSVSDYVVKCAPCPVLVARPKEEEEKEE